MLHFGCLLVWGDAGARFLRVRLLSEMQVDGQDAPPEALDWLRGYLQGDTHACLQGWTWPLDFSESGCTPKQQQTLQTLQQQVGFAQTCTYGELAHMTFGETSYARAVGGALARNPLPIIVPCHRVVGAGGALGGFSLTGGVRTKRLLLAHEKPGSVYGNRETVIPPVGE